MWLQSARAYCAMAMGGLGQYEAARELMLSTMAAWRKAGCNTLLGLFTQHLALIELGLGRLDEALALASEAISLDREFHDYVNLPRAYETRALILAERAETGLSRGRSGYRARARNCEGAGRAGGGGEALGAPPRPARPASRGGRLIAGVADQPIRVAVIGGGCAAMTAAFELTKPEHEGRFAVTVYQLGWRLGGKGASGRGPAGRIEEHGLHIWLGFYENAFALMREAYAEAARDPQTCPIATWRDAFFPDPHVGVADRSGAGDWGEWMALFPRRPACPATPSGRTAPSR